MGNVFVNLNDKEKRKLLNSLKVHTMSYHKEAILNRELSGDFLGIILYGTIEISRTNARGTKTILDTLEDGDVFSSSISNISEEYEITVTKDISIIFINLNDITSYQGYHKAYYQKFMKNLFINSLNKIKEKNERIQLLTLKTIREKLLAYFDIQMKKNNSKSFNLLMTYTALADYLAIDRSAMMRELKNLRDDKLIKDINKKITILYE